MRRGHTPRKARGRMRRFATLASLALGEKGVSAPFAGTGSEKAMRIAVAEPALPIVAMAISSTTQCANASDLPLWQTTHTVADPKGFRYSTRSPIGTSPVAHGMAPWYFSSQFGLFF